MPEADPAEAVLSLATGVAPFNDTIDLDARAGRGAAQGGGLRLPRRCASTAAVTEPVVE